MGELREAIRASLERHISESGYSQKEIAEKLGVSKSSVTNWIKGKNSPDVELVLPICKLLNISVREFYGEPDIEGTITTKNAPSELSEEALNIAKQYNELDERGRGAVKAILSYESEVVRPKPSKEMSKVIQLPKGMRRRGPMTEVDVYDEPSAAGLGNYVDVVVPRHMEQYPSEMVPPGANFGVLISGNSMEPKIPDRSTVFVQAAPALDSGEIGIFVLDGQAYCKQLKIDHDHQRTVLHSINPDYDDIEIPPWAEFRTLGRVLDWFTPRKFE